jgi:hypothetical protein
MKPRALLPAGLLLILLLSACGGAQVAQEPSPTPAPTEPPPTATWTATPAPTETPSPVPPTATPTLTATPSATPTPTLTPTPTETPSPSPTPDPALLRDDFSDPDSGWEVVEWEDGSVGYGDGIYFARAVLDAQFVWGIAGREFTNTVIEVETTQVEAPANNNNGYGVMCRAREQEGGGDEGYVLRISGDGYYSIMRIVAGEFQALVDWTTSPVINQGNASNSLRAVCDGPRLALYVNGELLAETKDTSFAAGDIALSATTYEADPTEIHFDNLVVLDPADEEEAAQE